MSRASLILIFTLFALLSIPTPARALGLAPGMLSLPDPYVGTIEVVDVLRGLPAGGVVITSLFGSIGPADDTFVFRLTRGADSEGDDTQVWIYATEVCGVCDDEVAFGTIPGPDSDVTGAFFTFDIVRLGLFPPETTTDLFFLSFTAGTAQVGDSLGLVIPTDPIRDIGSFTVVPEPASALLLGLGLAGIRLSGRRARGRSCGRRARRCESPRPRPA